MSIDNIVTINGIDIDLKKIGINFSLNKDQLDGLNRLADFLEDEDASSTVLSGSAGTGKSSIVKVLMAYVDKKYKDGGTQIVLAAPTHKAKIVLNRLAATSITKTLHKLLGLKPDVSITHFDAKDLQFYINLILDLFPTGKTVYIIDECSMINDHLFELVIDKLAQNGDKVIFIGDSKQLSPVKQETQSKTFTGTDFKGVNLTKVERQIEGNPLLSYLVKLRDVPIDRFIQDAEKGEGLYCFDDIKPFCIAMQKKHVNNNFVENPYGTKVLTYTNSRAGEINEFVRKKIYKRTKPIEVGDVLMGTDTYDPAGKGNALVYNGSDYVVLSMEKTVQPLPYHGDVAGYYVRLYDTVDNGKFTIFMIDPELSEKDKSGIAWTLESIRQSAIRVGAKPYTRKVAWGQWFKLLASFTTFEDLMFQGRTIRKAGFSYGYAITTHKSQGSTYDDVFIDMKDLNSCPNQGLRRELQYVALSRARNNAYLIQ